MSVEIPHKLYFKIGEVAKLVCVAPHVLRYWEGEFCEIQPRRANSNQRLYRREDVEIIVLIKSLLHDQGYTLTGAKKFLANTNQVPVDSTNTVKLNQLSTIKSELLAVKEMLK